MQSVLTETYSTAFGTVGGSVSWPHSLGATAVLAVFQITSPMDGTFTHYRTEVAASADAAFA